MTVNRPRVLIIMTDQQRADAMGCAGHPMVETPHMDRLAREGMRFTNAFTVSPVCMPSRISFITGLYPHNHTVWYNRGHLQEGNATMFQTMKNAGYSTAFIGKSHYYDPRPNTHMKEYENYMRSLGIDYTDEITGPFGMLAEGHQSYMTDEWKSKGIHQLYLSDVKERKRDHSMVKISPLEVADYPDSYIGRKAVEFVEHYDSEQPLCMYVSFVGPHDPWDAPGEYAGMYDPNETPKAVPVPEYAKQPAAEIQKRQDFHIQVDNPEQIKKIRANYYGKISLIDHWIGQILSAYERKGWLEDLLVVFCSDHGEMAGDHGRLTKRTFHEASIRIPLIIRWPGKVCQAAESDVLLENIDIIPTLLEALDMKQPDSNLGKSFWDVICDRTDEHRSHVLSEIFYGGHRNTMIRTKQYKYAVDQSGEPYMLFDLKEDPDEQSNLAGSTDRGPLEQTLSNCC